MDLEKLAYLTDDEKSEYLRFERLFQSDGWILITEWLERLQQAATERVLTAQKWDDHVSFSGMRVAYAQLLALPDAVENQFESVATSRYEHARQVEETQYE